MSVVCLYLRLADTNNGHRPDYPERDKKSSQIIPFVGTGGKKSCRDIPGNRDNYISSDEKRFSMTYEGYENYETYVTVLWLDSVLIDRQMLACELIDLKSKHHNDKEKIRLGMARYIERRINDKADYIRRAWDTKDNNGDPDDALQQIIIDFINTSIEKINFYEVAGQFSED